jgi:hypothetical protein
MDKAIAQATEAVSDFARDSKYLIRKCNYPDRRGMPYESFLADILRVSKDCLRYAHWFSHHGLYWLLCQTHPHPSEQFYTWRISSLNKHWLVLTCLLLRVCLNLKENSVQKMKAQLSFKIVDLDQRKVPTSVVRVGEVQTKKSNEIHRTNQPFWWLLPLTLASVH